MKENMPAIVMPILLIIAGIISPSNGVDDGYNKSPFELLSTAFIIMLVGIISYFIFKDAKWPSISNRKSKNI
jgi:hypothetical protein